MSRAPWSTAALRYRREGPVDGEKLAVACDGKVAKIGVERLIRLVADAHAAYAGEHREGGRSARRKWMARSGSLWPWIQAAAYSRPRRKRDRLTI